MRFNVIEKLTIILLWHSFGAREIECDRIRTLYSVLVFGNEYDNLVNDQIGLSSRIKIIRLDKCVFGWIISTDSTLVCFFSSISQISSSSFSTELSKISTPILDFIVTLLLILFFVAASSRQMMKIHFSVSNTVTEKLTKKKYFQDDNGLHSK